MAIENLLVRAARALQKGSPDQERDDHGRFASGGDSGRLSTDVQDKHSVKFNENKPTTSDAHIERAKYHQDQAAIANNEGRYADQQYHESKFEEHMNMADKFLIGKRGSVTRIDKLITRGAVAVLKGSLDQPRDDHGRFGSGSGGTSDHKDYNDAHAAARELAGKLGKDVHIETTIKGPNDNRQVVFSVNTEGRGEPVGARGTGYQSSTRGFKDREQAEASGRDAYGKGNFVLTEESGKDAQGQQLYTLSPKLGQGPVISPPIEEASEPSSRQSIQQAERWGAKAHVENGNLRVTGEKAVVAHLLRSWGYKGEANRLKRVAKGSPDQEIDSRCKD